MPRTHFGICNFCDASCGLEIELEGREILSIRGDQRDPFSRGHICPKGTAQKDVLDDPDRLRHPLRRRGRDWEEISWDEAIREAGERVAELQRRHGRDAFAMYYGNPVGHSYQSMLALLPLLKLAQTRSVFSSGSVDAHPRMLVSMFLYGNQALLPVPDIERTSLLVVQGANPMVSNGSVMTAPDIKKRLRAIRERGGRIVVIDPRFTETSAIADEHHFIRPGSDALLLLSVLHVLEAEGRFARARREMVSGLGELAQIVRAFPPERVTSAVGMEPAAIRALARAFATAPSAVWYGRMGISTQEFGCVSTWLVDVINVVTGNFDRVGGAMFTTPAVDLAAIARLIGETGKFDRWRSRVGRLPEYNGEFPVAALADEIETAGAGQIRGLLTIAGNPVLSNPNGRRLDRVFAALEYMISIDFYLNETTRHAHLILPAMAGLEGDHYPMLEYAMSVRNFARYAKAAVPPADAARPDWQILLDLTEAITRARGGPWRLATPGLRLLAKGLGSGAVLDALLRSGPHRLRLRDLEQQVHGIDLGPLEPHIRACIATPDRKVNLVPNVFVADLARLERKLAGTESESGAAGRFSLVSRRTLRSMNSWLHNSLRLVRGPTRCTLLMHPANAARLGVVSGQTVRVRSRVGEIEVPIEVSDDVMTGVVSLPYGWGHDRVGTRLSVAREHAGASLNDLADERSFDAVSGTSVIDGIPVEIAPI